MEKDAFFLVAAVTNCAYYPVLVFEDLCHYHVLDELYSLVSEVLDLW